MSAAPDTPDPGTRRRRVVAAVVASLSVAVVSLWLLRPPAPSPAPPPPEDPFPLPAWPASPFRNTAPEVAFVGSEVCRACHPDEHASFRRTGMGRSTAEIDPKQMPPDGAFDHEASKRRYRVYRKDGRLWHRESLLAGGAAETVLNDVPVKYVVGSGAHAQTFLAEIDGFLVESPITWYAARRAWNMSPGFDRPEHAGFQRGVGETCLYCHAGRAEAVERSYHRMKMDEPAIGCERCHGPGELHVRRHAPPPGRHAKGAADDTIVNPARLPRALAEAVCQQCHLQAGATVTARGRKPGDFRPGLPLEEFRHDYRLEVADVPVKVVGHAEQLRLSRCYQASDMTCLTCHNPHHEPEPPQRDEHYRAVCLSCHKPAECKVDPTRRERESPDNRCVQCHMPRAATEVAHVAFTHHRIGKQFQSAEAPVSQAGELKPVLPLPALIEVDRQRSLGLGYLEVANRLHDPALSGDYARRALDFLAPARAAGLRDPLADAGLANAHALLKRDVLKYADEALAHPGLPAPERCAVMFDRAQALAGQGRPAEAVETLRELVTLRRNALDWLTLGDCERARGDAAGSVAAFEAAVRINPRLWKVQRYLANHYRRLGNEERAAWHEARAVP